MLLSDFTLWHHVLNYWYIPLSEAEGEAFELELDQRGLSFFLDKPLPDPLYHERIVQSWERVFDLDWCDPAFTDPFEQKAIQATLWELREEQIRDCTYFTAR